MNMQTSIRRRAGVAVGAVALASLLGGGVAYAGTQTNSPGPSETSCTTHGPQAAPPPPRYPR